MSFINTIIKNNYDDPLIQEKILNSELLQYIDKKTKSVNSSSKSRGSFANLFALYVVIEDYIEKGFYDKNTEYENYEGAQFNQLMERQRTLPFGKKLQNHALNNRCNSEFLKYFNDESLLPIFHNKKNNKYKINTKLLIIEGKNICKDVIEIIDKYISLKLDNFNLFFEKCEEILINLNFNKDIAVDFIKSQLDINIDARIFEIVSYCLVKFYYHDKYVYIGNEKNQIKKHNISIFKTGRTNANDGGIDFIMKPLGKIFQVTETLDFKKFFLDIDKLNRYPISFIIKTKYDSETVFNKIKKDAEKIYDSDVVIEKYLSCFEEIITINNLHFYLNEIIRKNFLKEFFNELIIQIKIEYNLFNIKK